MFNNWFSTGNAPVLANFCGVNVITIVNFKLPICGQQTKSWEETNIVSSRQHQLALEYPLLPPHISTMSVMYCQKYWLKDLHQQKILLLHKPRSLVWSSIFIMEGSPPLSHIPKFQRKRKFEVRARYELIPKPKAIHFGLCSLKTWRDRDWLDVPKPETQLGYNILCLSLFLGIDTCF